MNNKTKPTLEFRILMSPLTRRIYAGNVRRDPKNPSVATAKGIRHDVTQSFYIVLLQLADIHEDTREGGFYITDEKGEKTYEVTIKRP